MEDQPYFIWFVLSRARKEGTVGPWWLIESQFLKCACKSIDLRPGESSNLGG